MARLISNWNDESRAGFRKYAGCSCADRQHEDGMVLDSANEERIYCPEYIKKYGERLHCGIRITSNHLNPVYVRNDILGISKKPPRDGDTCILIHKPTGRAFIRKIATGKSLSSAPDQRLWRYYHS